jgi:hypothetical protein
VSRELTYWNDETIQLVRDHFIAVAVPTSVCREEGPEGEFLRAAGIHKRWVTSSGYLHCVSASGKLLGGAASPEVLAAFEALPEAERVPGAVRVPDLAVEERTVPAPPVGGLVLRVHARFLAREGTNGPLRPARGEDFPLMRGDPEITRAWRLYLQPNTESMWLTRDEGQALVPADPRVGQRIPVDPAIPMRMARFHLNPKRATTSEDGIIRAEAVQTARMELVVVSVTAKTIAMRVEGDVHWGSTYDAAKATTPNGPLDLGFAAPLHGRVEIDRSKGTITRFDMVAPGHVWGRWGDANNKSMVVERPGRAPFGFAFELAPGDSPTDHIPPGGNGRALDPAYGYFSDPR